jgi:hypothetical protein
VAAGNFAPQNRDTTGTTRAAANEGRSLRHRKRDLPLDLGVDEGRHVSRARVVGGRSMWFSTEIDQWLAGLPVRRLKGDQESEAEHNNTAA